MVSSFLSDFEGLWRRPAGDYKIATKSHLITLDTNVLLELYRFTPSARNELLDVIEQLRDRIWIPHQVASEYYSRRMDAVKDHLKLYDTIPNTLDELERKAIQELHILVKRCSLTESDKRNLIAPIEAGFKKARTEVERHANAFDLTLTGVISDDPILSALARILDAKVGQPFKPEEAETLKAEAERRYQEKTPPGYKDANKSENSHGDFFIWEQILREAEVRKMPLLLVTNDTKEDWVEKESGIVIGARRELIIEFRQRCDADFMIVQLGSFLKLAKEELGASVSASTLEQAQNLQEETSAKAAELEISLSEEDYQRISDVLLEEANRWESTANQDSLSPWSQEKARERAAAALSLAERIEQNTADPISHGRIKLKISRADWEDLLRIQRRNPHLTRWHRNSLFETSSISYKQLWLHLTDLENLRKILGTEHDEGIQALREARLELKSSLEAKRGGRELADAENQVATVESMLRDIKQRTVEVDAQIRKIRAMADKKMENGRTDPPS
ncbi:PIN domain-containing protein [Streptomyces flaveus]|uniref:PIN like domain-containing protein n=1 Tax=Streptomyces flaveus TaxID=66370 RepID=A0A917QRP7_9ACTN|nr:PIN domain-containing protein [Streptomyces flaveus]GGK65779.1 hypothetical protein GCM10010094_28550 [Streptomyces flaveus]